MASDTEDDWESDLERLVDDALDSAEADEEARIVRIEIEGIEQEFKDADDLRAALVDQVKDQISMYDLQVDEDFDVDWFVDERIWRTDIESRFDFPHQEPDPNQLLLRFDELLPESAEERTRVDLVAINEELIRYLATHPEQMRHLHPRKFEELVAELFRDMGWDVLLTPKTRDGGIDFRAFRKEPFGTILTLVECKRYRPERKVGVGVVRALYGVLGMHDASHAVIATTSFFTRDAKTEREQVRGRMSLADFNGLSEWLQRYGNGSRSR